MNLETKADKGFLALSTSRLGFSLDTYGRYKNRDMALRLSYLGRAVLRPVLRSLPLFTALPQIEALEDRTRLDLPQPPSS
jgi:hypothetical protein